MDLEPYVNAPDPNLYDLLTVRCSEGGLSEGAPVVRLLRVL